MPLCTLHALLRCTCVQRHRVCRLDALHSAIRRVFLGPIRYYSQPQVPVAENTMSGPFGRYVLVRCYMLVSQFSMSIRASPNNSPPFTLRHSPLGVVSASVVTHFGATCGTSQRALRQYRSGQTGFSMEAYSYIAGRHRSSPEVQYTKAEIFDILPTSWKLVG